MRHRALRGRDVGPVSPQRVGDHDSQQPARDQTNKVDPGVIMPGIGTDQ